MTFEEAHEKDCELVGADKYHLLPPLLPCRCGGDAHMDVSMALIQCNRCEMSFEYRYDKGVIPYYTWQLIAGGEKYEDLRG
jgi:hypothetical protein